MYFIIDELDRCRPDFALEILEAAKHFFNANHVHFIFGINSLALEAQIETSYGGKVSGHQYLSKFFNYQIMLGIEKTTLSRESISKFAQECWQRCNIPERHDDIKLDCCDLFAHLCAMGQISLRDIERQMTTLSFCLHFLGKNYLRTPEIMISLIAIREGKPELFQKIKNSEAKYEEVREFFSLKHNPESYEYNENPLRWIALVFSAFMTPREDRTKEHREVISNFRSFNVQDDLLAHFAGKVLDHIHVPREAPK